MRTPSFTKTSLKSAWSNQKLLSAQENYINISNKKKLIINCKLILYRLFADKNPSVTCVSGENVRKSQVSAQRG